MGRSSEDLVERYGPLRATESDAQRAERWRQIDEIWNRLLTGQIPPGQIDAAQAQLAHLRGDDPDEFGGSED